MNHQNNQYNRSNQMNNQGQTNQYKQSQYQTGQNIHSGQYGQQTGSQNQYNLRQPVSQQNIQGQYYQQNQQSMMQQSNTIQNPKKGIIENKSPEMNDRDFLNDILATEKYLTDGFNTFAREASHNDLHNDIRTILNETHDCERDLFNLMFKDGFYSFQ
ncbi:MAG: spore coat protein, partial [Bacillota bacterium]